MTQVQQLAEDLRFVRGAVEQREQRRRQSRWLAAYWGAYVVVGYTLIDVARHAAPWFFLIGLIVGVMLSPILGRRAAKQEGIIDRREGLRHLLRWLSSFVVAYAAAEGLSYTLHLNQMGGSQVFVVLIGMIYFLAGLYGPSNVRYMLVGGPAVMAGAIFVNLVPHFGWTCLGVLIAACICGPMFSRTRGSHAAE
jgi:hypothetical protein